MPRHSIIKKLKRTATSAKHAHQRRHNVRMRAHRPTRDDLINAEAAFGRTLFGPIPADHRREFFHHQQNTWIWHESWLENGQRRATTVRYEVRPAGVFKRAGRARYVKLEGAELSNFRRAAHAYLKIIKEKLYN